MMHFPGLVPPAPKTLLFLLETIYIPFVNVCKVRSIGRWAVGRFERNLFTLSQSQCTPFVNVQFLQNNRDKCGQKKSADRFRNHQHFRIINRDVVDSNATS
jgi:hypothetical protein